MTTSNADELKLWEVTHRETGERWLAISKTAGEACEQAGWLIGLCFVREQLPHYRPTKKDGTMPLYKVPTELCPFQYCSCSKPGDQDCPVQPNAPELDEWLKQASEAHLCPHQGQELTKTDYQKNQRWVTKQEAIESLSPKP